MYTTVHKNLMSERDLSERRFTGEHELEWSARLGREGLCGARWDRAEY